jgi:hypothetical protein
MRTKFHSNKLPGQGGYGAFVFESEPQHRSLLIYGDPVPKRVALPWLVFAVRYIVGNDGKFTFRGIYANGLGVYFRKEPLKSFDDPLYHSITDYGRNGISCTDHRFDALVCDTAEEIAGTVLDIWWNTPHMIYFPEDGSYANYATASQKWVKETPESMLKKTYNPITGNLRTLLPVSIDEQMVDEPVPKLKSCFFQKINMIKKV